MTRRDRNFLLITLGLTALVAAPLAVFSPLDEERGRMGVMVGWGLALLIMVPSYLLLSAGMAGDGARFVKGFMAGASLRLVLTAVAVLLFARVERAPIYSFVMAYFLGYTLLTAVELKLTLPRGTRKVSA